MNDLPVHVCIPLLDAKTISIAHTTSHWSRASFTVLFY